jgi:predicted site-specific integrase-resolvase
MSALEETFTDKEFCEALKVDRATSLRWRNQGLVGFIKLPNGQIRYLRRHIEEAIKDRTKEKKVAA